MKKKSIKKAQGGISLPTNQQDADLENYHNFMLENQQMANVPQDYGQYSDVMPIPNVQMQGFSQNPSVVNNYPQPRQPQPYNGEIGSAALMGLSGVAALLPNRKQPSTVVRPLNSYNEKPYGRGSRALAQNGASLVAPQGYKPSSLQQRKDWNSFLDYLDTQGVQGSTTLDKRDQNLWKSQMDTYRKANPNTTIDSNFVPFAQYEGALIRGGQEVPGVASKKVVDNFQSVFAEPWRKNVSPVDGWVGSVTSKMYYPRQRGQGATPTFLEDYEQFNQFISQPPQVTNYKNGGRLSNMGYKSNSPDRWEPQLTIPSNQITMEDVPHPIYGVDDLGYSQMMYPNEEYTFPGTTVTEIPIRKSGGKMKCKNGGRIGYEEGKTYNMSDDDIRYLVSQGYELKID